MLLEEHEKTGRAITQYDAGNTGFKACDRHRPGRFLFFISMCLSQENTERKMYLLCNLREVPFLFDMFWNLLCWKREIGPDRKKKRAELMWLHHHIPSSASKPARIKKG